MEYLSLQKVITLKEDIKQEMSSLLSNKAVVLKPNSLQWQFFSDCVNKLFNSLHPSKFSSLNNSQKAKLKFEVEDKLRKFYLRPGRQINFVFKMINKKELKNIFFNKLTPKRVKEVIMKRLIILSFVLMFLGTLGVEVFAQDPPLVFGWDVYTIPEFPVNDSISLSPSTEVNSFPEIPGYNNENSLQVNITSGGTGYSFIGRTFPEPFTMPQLCNFVVKHENGYPPTVRPLIKYQGNWYQPTTSIT